MNTFRDPETNESVHVPTESDDPTWRFGPQRQPEGAVSTGASGKYSPINQERAKERGYAVPEGMPDAVKRVVGYGQIHPRES